MSADLPYLLLLSVKIPGIRGNAVTTAAAFRPFPRRVPFIDVSRGTGDFVVPRETIFTLI